MNLNADAPLQCHAPSSLAWHRELLRDTESSSRGIGPHARGQGWKEETLRRWSPRHTSSTRRGSPQLCTYITVSDFSRRMKPNAAQGRAARRRLPGLERPRGVEPHHQVIGGVY